MLQGFAPEPAPGAAWAAAWQECGLQPTQDALPPQKFLLPGPLTKRHLVWRIPTGDLGLRAGVAASFCDVDGAFYMARQYTIITALLSGTPDGSSGFSCLG